MLNVLHPRKTKVYPNKLLSRHVYILHILMKSMTDIILGPENIGNLNLNVN